MVVNINNLVKRYDKLVALDHLNIQVNEGEIFGLLGPNGSGKTTAINCLLSLLKYDKGTIEVFGKQMKPNSYEIKRDIGVIMQNVAVFNDLTVYDNIYYFCSLYINDKDKIKKYVQEAIEFTALEEFVKFYPKKLSGGLLRRLNIACGIAHKPKLIILDEPTVAVDPQSRNKILEGIKELNKNGATVIYTTHYMEEVEQLCNRISIMDKGKVIASGTIEELKAMISHGEKITITIYQLPNEIKGGIEQLPNVLYTEYNEGKLIVHSSKGKNNLITVLRYLDDNNISYVDVYTEMPTLNDVFLEITGKNLRDS